MQTYARELLRALPSAVAADLVAVVQSDAAGELPAGVAARCRPPCDGVRRSLESMRGPGPADLVHGLDVDLPLRPGAPTVATVHDLALLDTPWAFGRLRRAGKRWTTRGSVRRADAVIAVSAFTAERVRHHFGRDAVVIHEAPSPDLAPPAPQEVDAVRAHHALPERFVLHVGTVEPRKDVPTLAAACRRAGVPLVLAGASGASGAAGAAGAARGPGVPPPDGARALGYVERAELAALFGAATVVAYVSRYEGFGLPPLEAMACGAPVLSTRVGALPEIGGGAITFVPAGDDAAQAGALRALLAEPDRRRELAAAGLAAAGRLTWAATARATASVYRGLGVA